MLGVSAGQSVPRKPRCAECALVGQGVREYVVTGLYEAMGHRSAVVALHAKVWKAVAH